MQARVTSVPRYRLCPSASSCSRSRTSSGMNVRTLACPAVPCGALLGDMAGNPSLYLGRAKPPAPAWAPGRVGEEGEEELGQVCQANHDQHGAGGAEHVQDVVPPVRVEVATDVAVQQLLELTPEVVAD